MSWRIRRVVQSVTFCALLLLSANLLAQGCASCYTTAAAGGSQTAHALRAGILLLVFPPTLIFICVIVTLQRWKSPDRNNRLEFLEGEENK